MFNQDYKDMLEILSDIITRIDGVSFEEAHAHREIIAVDGLVLPFLSKADLIKNKSSTGRKKDLLDIEILKGAE